MTVTLLMATTVNGYITGLNDDTDWVKDFEALYQTVAEFGVVVMGRRTYDESVKYDAFPYKGALNIVMTRDPELLKKSADRVLFEELSPAEVLELVKDRGFEKLLLIGGGHLNGSFLKEHLINEVVLDIHPLLLSEGIKVCEGQFPDQKLELVDSKVINDQILQVRYKLK